MPYCTAGTKATVTYQFAGGIPKVFITDKTPIEVDISKTYTLGAVGGQCVCTEYRVYFSYSKSAFPGQRTYSSNTTWGAVEGITYIQSVGNNFTIYLVGRGKKPNPCGVPGQKSIVTSGGLFTGESILDVRIESIAIESTGFNNCGDAKTLCSIEVLHKNNLLFIDKGDCPVTFSVVCGDECPDGTIKCAADVYPGYCCLPCEPIKSEIIAIKNYVQTINKEPVSNG